MGSCQWERVPEKLTLPFLDAVRLRLLMSVYRIEIPVNGHFDRSVPLGSVKWGHSLELTENEKSSVTLCPSSLGGMGPEGEGR